MSPGHLERERVRAALACGAIVEDDLMHELAAAYALDALDQSDARAFEDHLARCDRCRDELAEFTRATRALAHDARPATPPAELRDRIVAAARVQRQAPKRKRSRRIAPAFAFAATAACAVIAVGIWKMTSTASPRLTAVPLRGAHGALVLSGDRSGVLVVTGLHRAPAGRTYEIWVMRDKAAAKPAGLFAGGAPTARVRLVRRVPHGSFVGVTVERAGGAFAPSSAPIFTSTTS